jgi:hypothetical protein
MEAVNNTENIIVAVMGLVIILLFIPSTKEALKRSKEKTADWAGLLLPLGLVVAFVIFLIAMV